MSEQLLFDGSDAFPESRSVPAPGRHWTIDDTVRLLAVGREGYDLTAEQRAAVAAPLGPGLLIAGAGSGKTEVMAARVLHLVATGQVRPDAVLGLTFTVKATASLAERIRSVLERLRHHTDRLGTTQPADRTGTRSIAPGAAPDLLDGEPTVSTYNGFGARIVGDHGLRIGIEPGVRLATEGLRWQLALRVVRTWTGRLDVEVQPATVADQLRQICDELANHLATADGVRAAHASLREWIAGAEASGTRIVKDVAAALSGADIREQLLALAQAYEDAKRERSLLDHGDQIALAARLADVPAVRAAERAQFRVVLLDEYQDTNVAQRVLLQRLFGDGHPVTAVGDPAQSIYAFRGASVSNIVRFGVHFPTAAGRPAPVYPLSTNFRSGGNILTVANAVSGGLDVIAAGDGAAPVGPPVLVPRPGREGAPSAGAPMTSSALPEPAYAEAAAGIVQAALLEDVEQEAAWVADHLVAANLARRPGHGSSCGAEGCDGWHQLAVLCRKRAQFGLLRTALEHRGVPVEVVGLGGLLDAPEVADVVAVLRVLHDPTSNDSMIRLLTGPRWRIGPRDLEALGRRARGLLASTAGARPRSGRDVAATTSGLALAVLTDDADVGALADAVERVDDPTVETTAPLSPEAQDRLVELRDDLAALRRRLGQPLPDLVADVERTLGLDVELEATPQALGRGRRANILAFSEVAANFVGIDGETHLGAFLASLDAAEQAEDGYDLGTPSPADTVKLLTVHAAKGLEWDVVAVPGLSGSGSHSVFPSARPSPLWPRRPERLPAAVRGDREDLPVWSEPTAKGLEAYKAANRQRDLQEERRLAYVAVTRARDVLFCSGYWWGATAAKPYAPSSPFYDEVEEVCRDGAGVAAERPPQPAKDDPNPLLDADAARDVPWPVPPTVPVGVRWSAEAVRAEQEALAKPADASVAEPAPLDLSPEDAARMAVWRRDADLLLREQAAAGGGPQVVLPADLSVSDVVELDGRTDDLARRLHRPLPRQPAPAARRGTAFHAWLEQRHQGSSLLGPDDLPGAGDEDVADDAMPGRPPEGPGELEVLQAAFLGSSWADRVPVAVEVPFELLLGGHLVRGRIDAVYTAPDGTFDVVDYKTGRRPSGAAATAAAVQLACYRLAWSELAGVDERQVGAAFLYVADGDAGLVRPPLRDRRALEEMLAALPAAEQPDAPPSTEVAPPPSPQG